MLSVKYKDCEGEMSKLQDRYVEYGLHQLYVKAVVEQAQKDHRIVSPEMKIIQELRDWYFRKDTPNDPEED